MQPTTIIQVKPTVGRRLVSMLLDHIIMCFVLAIVLGPFILPDLSFRNTNPSQLTTKDVLFLIVIIVIYALKDSFNGRSLAKRIMKLQVVDNNTGEAASVLQCFIRNLLDPLWIIEVVVVFFNPQRRLGDLLANTRVVAIQLM